MSVSRSIFALVDDRDRAYFGARRPRRRTRSATSTPTRARSSAARTPPSPTRSSKQLAADEAIAAADTLLLTVPNQLGVDYNAHVHREHPEVRRAGARLALSRRTRTRLTRSRHERRTSRRRPAPTDVADPSGESARRCPRALRLRSCRAPHRPGPGGRRLRGGAPVLRSIGFSVHGWSSTSGSSTVTS